MRRKSIMGMAMVGAAMSALASSAFETSQSVSSTFTPPRRKTRKNKPVRVSRGSIAPYKHDDVKESARRRRQLFKIAEKRRLKREHPRMSKRERIEAVQEFLDNGAVIYDVNDLPVNLRPAA